MEIAFFLFLLEGVTYVKVSPANIHAILNVFHKNLKGVSFIECNLVDLERCIYPVAEHAYFEHLVFELLKARSH